MLSRDLFHFAVTISFQQARARVRRNIVAFAGICGGIVLVLVQLGFQSALYESAVRMHRLLNGEVVVIAEEFRSIQNPTWLPREWLVLTLAHPAVSAGSRYSELMSVSSNCAPTQTPQRWPVNCGLCFPRG